MFGSVGSIINQEAESLYDIEIPNSLGLDTFL